jgi:RHS repeat-associated protein
MLAGVDINGGLSWNGWTSRGFSNQLGVYGSGGTSEVYEVYTTSFAFNKSSNTITGNPVQAVEPAATGFSSGRLAYTPFGKVAVSAGAFADGNTILGVGVRVVSGGSVAGFKPTLRRSSATYPQAKLAGGGPITESWTYSQPFSTLTSATDGRGNTTTFSLDARGNTEEIRAPLSRTSYFAYTPAPTGIGGLQGGLVIRATDPRGSLVVTDYFQPSETNGTTTLAGLVKQVTAGILDSTPGRVNGLIALPTDKTVQTFTYDAQRNPESATQKMDGVGPDRKTSYVYDLLDRLVTVTAPAAIQVEPSGALSATPQSPITKYTYDRVGRLKEMVDPLGRVTTTEYDDVARTENLLQPAAPQVVTFIPGVGSITVRPTTLTTRDPGGNVVSLRDANGNETTFTYDARNQLETKTLPLIAANLVPSVFTYTYDSAGNVASETRPATNIAAGTPDRKTTFQYDALHRLTRETRPTPGGVSTHVAPLTAMTYDDAGNRKSVTDPERRLTTYDYDAANRLITITAPAVDTGGPATVTKYGYDRSDNLTVVRDAKNNDADVVSIYDPLNRKVKDTFVAVKHFNDGNITTPASSEYAYNDAGELTATTDRLGRTTNREYDALGRLTKVIQPAVAAGTPTTVMQYDAVGNLRLVYDPLQSQALSALSRTEYEYDALDRRTIVRSPAPGGSGGTDRPVIKTGYDILGNVRTVTDPRGKITSTNYNAHNLPTLVMQSDPGPGADGTAADHPPVLTAFTYDPAGNRIGEEVSSKATSWWLWTTTVMDYKTATEFDNLDRPYQVTDRTNLVTQTEYFADGLVKKQTQDATSKNSRSTEYGYDGLGRARLVIRQREENAFDSTSTTYDAVGNLIEILDPANNKTTFTYDAAYRKIGEKTFAYTTSTTNRPEVTRAYQYDRQNNLRLVTDRNGRKTQYDYDGLDRRTTESWLGTTGKGYVASFEYDLAGNLKSAADAYNKSPYSSVGYDLDGLYRAETVRTYLPGIAALNSSPNQFSSAVGYRYDLAGNRTRSELFVYGQTADLVTEYGFDNLNRATSIRQSGSAIYGRAVSLAYHADGRIRGVTRYGGSSLGAAVDPNPSASQLIGTSMSIFAPTTGRLTSLTHADSAGKAEVEYNFTYDAFDRIETYGEKRPQARTATNAAFAAIDKTYRYDRLDQVIEAGAESFSYDANGNRTANGYVTERDNRLARDPLFTYEYDREGNRTSRTVAAITSSGPGTLNNARTTYQWDHQNRLTKVINHSATIAPNGTVSYTPADTSAYAYDVLGRRVAVTHTSGIDPTKNFAKVSVYDGSQVVWTAEAKSPAALEAPRRTQTLLWGPDIDQLLAIQDGPAGSSSPKAPVWTLTDPQGTVKDYLAKPPTAGAESGLVATRSYSAFGTPEPAQVWASGPQGTFTDVSGPSGFFYVGQEYDAETGLQYSRARYYDPRSREFIGQDPLAFTAGDTNLYRRVGNSPVNATDPSGLEEIQPHVGSLRDPSKADFYRWLLPLGMDRMFYAEELVEYGRLIERDHASPLLSSSIGPESIQLINHGRDLEYGLLSPRDMSRVGYTDEFGHHMSFCMSCHDGTNPASRLKMDLARWTANSDWHVFFGNQAGDLALGRVTAACGMVDDVLRAGKNAVAPVRTVGDTIPEGRRLIVRPVEIEFPATGLSPAQQRAFASHLGEQEMRLNQLSLNHTDALKTNLANYPNIKAEVARSRRLARQFLPGSGSNMDAAHALDSVAGGYIYDFVGFRSKIQQQIGSLWRTRVDQIQPGKEHRLVPLFRNSSDGN